MTNSTPSNDSVLSAISTQLQNIDEVLKRNAKQLGVLTEGLTRLENAVSNGFEHLEDTINNGFQRLEQNLDRQYQVTEMQGRHIDLFIALLERQSNGNT